MKKSAATQRKAKVDNHNHHRTVRRTSGPVESVVGLAEAMAEIVRESGALELKLDFQQHSLRIRRRRHAAELAPQVSGEHGAHDENHEGDDDYLTPVSSLNVGVFRPLHPKTSKALVAAGDTVEANQCMGWVEAIGILHDVMAPRAGTVVEILAEPGDPVEFGQFLFLIQ